MQKTAIIGGSGFRHYRKKGIVFLQRHGKGIPPHKINHRKNIVRIKKKGIKNIIGISSVGSLKEKIRPGAIVVPHDYINLKHIETYHDIKARHIVPGLDESLRKKLIEAAKKARIKTVKKAVYIRTMGPRFETQAEVRFISDYADIVGMTMPDEATLAKEQGLKYACLCSVDNYANGIGKKPLSFEMIRKMQMENIHKIKSILDALK